LVRVDRVSRDSHPHSRFDAAIARDGDRTAGSQFVGTKGVDMSTSAVTSLTVTPNLDAAAIACHYRFTVTNGLPPREDRIDVIFAGDGPRRCK